MPVHAFRILKSGWGGKRKNKTVIRSPDVSSYKFSSLIFW